MMRLACRLRRVFASLGVLSACTLALLAGEPPGASGPPPKGDPALERTRAQARMLDDLFKVAVVDITNRYDGPPAAKVAKTIFAAAREKRYFSAKLLDATGSPQNEANAPKDEFERRASRAVAAGETYLEEVVGQGEQRRLRVATVVPAVVEKCAKCHGVKQGDVLGFLSYDLPVR
ncbi:MAG: DUF3365 domain-containing protein [Isosphaeraceae bacterium]